MKGMKTKFNKLQDIDKHNPFKVPENYFAHFNNEIMDCLPEKVFPKPEPVTLWQKVKPWVYLAAMFVGTYFIINFLTKDADPSLSSHQDTSTAISTDIPASNYWSNVHITEEEFYQYLEDQLIDDGFYDYLYYQMNF